MRIVATVINDIAYDQRMIRICNSLISFGYDVNIIGRNKANTPLTAQQFGQTRLRMIINRGPLFYLFFNIRLFILLLYKPYDCVHAVDLDTLLPAYLASKIRQKKLVYDAHEWFTEVPELKYRPKKRALWLRLEKFLLPKIKNALTVGDEIAEQLKMAYGLEFAVIRNCPELIPFENERESDEKFIIYQGALNKGRGIELLIEAASELDLKVVIAGSGDLDAELNQGVIARGLQNKVTFTGMLMPSALQILSRKATLAYNVSENMGKSYYYSLNNKFFDYIHAEVPAITNAFPEYVKLNDQYQCCLLIDFSKEQLISAVKLLLDDEALYAKLKKNCFLAKQKLNWGVEEKKLEAFYAKIT